MKMRLKIIIIFLIFVSILYSQKKDSFLIFKLGYSSAKLVYNDIRDSGIGTDFLYKILLSKEWAFSFDVGFFYLGYDVNASDSFYNPLKGKDFTINYEQDIKFYNFQIGFRLNYVFLLSEKYIRSSNKFLKNLFPYIGTGFYSTFPYKVVKNFYKSELDMAEKNFIEQKNSSYWLPGIATIPIIFGLEYNINPKIIANTEINYSFLIYDEFTKNNGYNNLLNIYLGILYKL